MQAVEIEDPIEVVIGNDVAMEMVNATETMSSTKTSVVLDIREDTLQDHESFVFNSTMKEEATENNQEQMLQYQQTFDTIMNRRVKECLKKRKLRENKEYRKKETERAKQRMANKRNNPVYRELERQKDRERRAEARKNSKFREKEKERDRLYKRRQKNSSGSNDNLKYAASDSINRTGSSNSVVVLVATNTIESFCDSALEENTSIEDDLSDSNMT